MGFGFNPATARGAAGSVKASRGSGLAVIDQYSDMGLGLVDASVVTVR